MAISSAAVLLAACTSGNDPADGPPSTQSVPDTTPTSIGAATDVVVVEGEHYREPADGDPSTVDIFLTDRPDSPLVVLLHGWGSGSPGRPAVDLAPFAAEVARLGATVFYFHWHTNNGFSAGSAADLSCIGGFVAARATQYGSKADSVVVVGHSMGGETGSALALSSFGLAPGPDCVETGEPPTPHAFLGIGGTYGLIAQPLDDDLTTFAVRATPRSSAREIAADDFVTPGLTALQAYAIDGHSALPSANPLRMVLLVGSNDQYPATNPTITAAFAEVLRAHRTDVEVVEVPGANHENVMYPDTEAGQATLQVVSELLTNTP